jgi:protein tyrosine phosphatase
MWWYIATQAPMEETTTDFWQMVWEQEVDVIAMLTDLSVSVEHMTVILLHVSL